MYIIYTYIRTYSKPLLIRIPFYKINAPTHDAAGWRVRGFSQVFFVTFVTVTNCHKNWSHVSQNLSQILFRSQNRHKIRPCAHECKHSRSKTLRLQFKVSHFVAVTEPFTPCFSVVSEPFSFFFRVS